MQILVKELEAWEKEQEKRVGIRSPERNIAWRAAIAYQSIHLTSYINRSKLVISEEWCKKSDYAQRGLEASTFLSQCTHTFGCWMNIQKYLSYCHYQHLFSIKLLNIQIVLTNTFFPKVLAFLFWSYGIYFNLMRIVCNLSCYGTFLTNGNTDFINIKSEWSVSYNYFFKLFKIFWLF